MGQSGIVVKIGILRLLLNYVEQGPVLDVQNTDIGVVSGIVGQRRCSVSVFGKENHMVPLP